MRKWRGYILGVLLVLLPILTMMMIALFVVLRGGHGSSNSYYARTASLFAAEAGLVDAMGVLQANRAWVSGFSQKPMKDVRGSYTVRFNQGAGPFQADDSVNNFDGAHPNSFRGNNTVPAGTALLVVVARVGGVERRLEALVGDTASLGMLDLPLLTTGRIRLQGDVRVDGITALNDSTSVDGDVQSNLTGTVNAIEWLDTGGTSLHIDGNVSSSANPGSINLAGGVVTGGTTENAAPRAVPPLDIPGEIAAKSSSPSPTVVPGGVTVVGTGDYYVAGNLDLTGDLDLQGGNLYVQGELSVQGTVSGTGSVYVGSHTKIHGNADINGQDNIALYSKGNVELRGFDGDAILDSLALSSPVAAKELADGKWAISEMATIMNNGSWTPGGIYDTVSQVLGEHLTGTPTGRDPSTMFRLRDRLNPTASTAQKFLHKRLDNIGRMFSGNSNYFGQSDATARDNFTNTGDTSGLVDAANDLNDSALMQVVYNLTSTLDFDSIGSANFQGLVYTNGSFYSANQITVVGAVVVNNDGSQSSSVIDGITVNPGDLFLNNGSKITFVQDFFDDGGGAGGQLGVVLWMGR